MKNNIQVSEAEQIILSYARDWGVEELWLNEAPGRILRADLRADRDFPPFDRVTMDGIAFNYAAFAAGQRVFPVAGIQAAGKPQQTLEQPGACMEVMTGAMLPLGTDTVVRYEDIHLENSHATVMVEQVAPGQNIHRQGIDRLCGDLIVPAGVKFGPTEAGTAATVGKNRLRVSALPRVLLISTGDELIEVPDIPRPYQIRRSNVYALRHLLQEKFGIISHSIHYKDDIEEIRSGLAERLDRYDITILNGAVSAGKFDFVPQVLEELGVEKCFHQVAQRPGRPFWFGNWQGKNIIFALPGNPVSAFTCACRYVVPFIEKSLGQTPLAPEYAVLAEDFEFKPALTFFLPVTLRSSADGRLMAAPRAGHGSGDLANLNDADGFLELPAGQTLFRQGEAFPLIAYRRQ